MACNSTGGGGGGANMAANAQTNVVVPQNSEWPVGDVDGFLNTSDYSEVTRFLGQTRIPKVRSINQALRRNGSIA